MKQDEMTADWLLYEKGIQYNNSINYYSTTNRNHRVFNNQHFDGVDLKGLRPYVMPMSQFIIQHKVAATMTSSVKMNFTVENVNDDSQDPEDVELQQMAKYLSSHSKDKWEKLKMDSVIRECLQNAALSGDMATYTYFDGDIETGQFDGEEEVLDKDGNPVLDDMGQPTYRPVPILGDFVTEVIDGGNIFLGNPNDKRINVHGRPRQPYILVTGREVVSTLRAEATKHQDENKLTEEEIKLICSDEDYQYQAGDRGKKEIQDDEYGKATYVIKLWPKDGTIHFNKSTKACEIRKDVDTKLKIYPVAWNNWDSIKNSYHGQAVMSGLVNNQIEIDRGFARIFKYIWDVAFPITIANKSYFPNGISNKAGQVVLYEGTESITPSQIYFQTQPGQMANGIVTFLMDALKQTMELMGAGESAMGNANPENTSAIQVNAKNSHIPLESVKANLYQFIEDIGYIWNEFMVRGYKQARKITTYDDNGNKVMQKFDPDKASRAKFRIVVDVGAGSILDEASIVSTMSNLFKAGITNAVQTLKRFPDNGMIPEKEALIKELEAKQKQMEMMQTEEYKGQVIAEFMGKVQEKLTQPTGGADGSQMPQVQ